MGATTEDVALRVIRHNQNYYGLNKYTKISDDWKLFIGIKCSGMKQATQIEKHIKNMKSCNYINNLKLYPEMISKLLQKYSDS